MRHRPLEFEVSDRVFLKAMPKRGVISSASAGSYGRGLLATVAYRLALPPSMSGVHEVFHVSMLRKYTLDPAHVVD